MSCGFFSNGSGWNKQLYVIHFDDESYSDFTADELCFAVLCKLSVTFKERKFQDLYVVDKSPYVVAWATEICFPNSNMKDNFSGGWYEFHEFIRPEDLGTMHYKTYSWDDRVNMTALNLVEKENIEELPLLKKIQKGILVQLYKKWFGKDPLIKDCSDVNFAAEYGKPAISPGSTDLTFGCGNMENWLANKILEK